MQRRFDLVVLDLDGTLVDSEALLVGLVNSVLIQCGFPSAAPRTVAAAIGLPLEEVFRRAAPAIADEPLQSLCLRYRTHANSLEFVRQFRLYPDVAETLATLRAAGVHVMVGTSKGRATTLDIVQHCAIDGLIDHVIGGDCVARGKPHPEMIEQALRTSATHESRTLMVGDTAFDIEMGQAAGVATCAVTYGMHPRAALHALRPDFMIDRFADLQQVVIGS